MSAAETKASGPVATFNAEGHVARLKDQGYTVIEGFLDADRLRLTREALLGHLGRHRGRNSFEGRGTERVYTLVARGKVFEEVTEDPRLLALLDAFLAPGYLLTASQAICIYPAEAQQGLHTDDSFYPIPRPRPPVSLTVIVAVDAFTAENGATVVVPGSHAWSDADVAEMRSDLATTGRSPLADGARPVVMPAGAALVLLGTLVHAGGENRSTQARLAFTNQYCQPWARTQENFFLGIPAEIARTFSPRLLQLLGYQTLGAIMGQVTGMNPRRALADGYVAPVALEPRL